MFSVPESPGALCPLRCLLSDRNAAGDDHLRARCRCQRARHQRAHRLAVTLALRPKGMQARHRVPVMRAAVTLALALLLCRGRGAVAQLVSPPTPIYHGILGFLPAKGRIDRTTAIASLTV